MMKKLFLTMSVPLLLLCGCKEKKKDIRIPLQVRVEPASALITFDGQDAGKGDVAGKVLPGKHLLKAEAEGYETEWRVIDLKTGSPKIVEKFFLVPCKGSVMIVSTPSGAEVTFDGRSTGSTPLILKGLPLGKYHALLKAPGYAAKEVTWTVDSNRPLSVTASLVSNMGKVSINSTPEDARVSINGNPVGVTPYETSLEQGKYQIAVELPGYEKYTNELTVNQGKSSELTIKLDEKLSNLTVKSNPRGASVRINGKDYGVTPLVLQNIKAGKYRVELSKPNYDSVVNAVNLPPGKSHTVSANLLENTGNIEFVTRPAGISVYMNDRLLFVTEKDKNNPEFSKVHRIPNLKPGTYTLRFQHKRAKKPVERTVDVKRGKTFRFSGNVELWIPNAVLFMKDGTKKVCRIVAELKNGDIAVEPSRGISYTEKKDRISRIQKFEEDER